MPRYPVFTESQREEIRNLLPAKSPRRDDFIGELDARIYPFRAYITKLSVPGLSQDKDAWSRETKLAKKAGEKLSRLRRVCEDLGKHMEDWRAFAETNRPYEPPFHSWNPKNQLSEIMDQIRIMERVLPNFTPDWNANEKQREREVIKALKQTWTEFFPESRLPKHAKAGSVFTNDHTTTRAAQVAMICIEAVTGTRPRDISRIW